jgi:hypothetical protein
MNAAWLARRIRGLAWVSASACAWGCGGEVASSQDATAAAAAPSNAAGVFALDSATIDDDATSPFGSNLLPKLRAICPGSTDADITIVTAIDATGGGNVVLTTPCAVYHVPVVGADITMLGDEKGTFSAIVPTEGLVTAMHDDLSDSSGAPCGDPSLGWLDAPIRGSSNLTVSLDDGPNIAAITMRIEFAGRETTSTPPPPKAQCQ